MLRVSHQRRRSLFPILSHPTLRSATALFNFVEGGGPVRDRLRRRFTGTLSGAGVSYQTSGRDGQRNLRMTGANQVQFSVAHSNFISASDGTIAVWMKPTGTAASASNAFQLPAVWSDANGWLGIARGSISGADRIWVFNWDANEDRIGVPYTNDEWVHIVWRHTGGTLYAYANGLLVGSVASGNTGAVTSNAFIGGSTAQFTGDVDEIITWNRALSEAEIFSLAQNPYAFYEKPRSRFFDLSADNLDLNISPPLIGANESVFSPSVFLDGAIGPDFIPANESVFDPIIAGPIVMPSKIEPTNFIFDPTITTTSGEEFFDVPVDVPETWPRGFAGFTIFCPPPSPNPSVSFSPTQFEHNGGYIVSITTDGGQAFEDGLYRVYVGSTGTDADTLCYSGSSGQGMLVEFRNGSAQFTTPSLPPGVYSITIVSKDGLTTNVFTDQLTFLPALIKSGTFAIRRLLPPRFFAGVRDVRILPYPQE